jgi:hypothetical protein
MSWRWCPASEKQLRRRYRRVWRWMTDGRPARWQRERMYASRHRIVNPVRCCRRISPTSTHPLDKAHQPYPRPPRIHTAAAPGESGDTRMADKRRGRVRAEGVHRSTMGVQVPLVEMDEGPAVEMEMERANGEQRGCVAPPWWPSTSCPLP